MSGNVLYSYQDGNTAITEQKVMTKISSVSAKIFPRKHFQ